MIAIDRKRLLVPLAVGSAVLAGLLAWFFLRHLEISYQETGEMVPVLAATRYIPRGTALRPSFFQQIRIPKSYAEPGVLAAFEVLESTPGRPRFRSLLSIPQGTQLVQRELVPLEKADALSQLIPDHQVAVSFAVNNTRGLGGNLQPGDLIDILRTVKGKEMESPQPTLLLFQAVPVIAVGKKWIPPGASEVSKSNLPNELLPEQEEETVLSVLLNPLAAVRLAEARENTTLSVVLRAPGDDLLMEKRP